MRVAMNVRAGLVCALAWTAAACARGPLPMRTLFPEERRVTGEAAQFGEGPVALSENGRRVEVRFAREAHVAILLLRRGEVEVLHVQQVAAGPRIFALPAAGQWVQSQGSGTVERNPTWAARCGPGAPAGRNPTEEASRQAECSRTPSRVSVPGGTRSTFTAGSDIVVVLVSSGPLRGMQVRRAVDRLADLEAVETEAPRRLELVPGAFGTWALAR